MGEQTFDAAELPSWPPPPPGERALVIAAELAEGLLEEVSAAGQDWRAVRERAEALAALAEAVLSEGGA